MAIAAQNMEDIFFLADNSDGTLLLRFFNIVE